MAEETTEVTQALAQELTTTSETELRGVPVSVETATTTSEPSPEAEVKPPETTAADSVPSDASTSTETKARDDIDPYIDKAFETIQHESEREELDKFLRAHIKSFREEWDGLTDSAKNAYVHLMASQLVQRKAAATQIKIGNEFKLPVPSAITTLFESIQQSQIKPLKRRPVLLMPPNLRPTYSLKK